MANHMAEVAKMLGVELGEEFKISNIEGYYYFDECGLKHRHNSNHIESAPAMFVALLNGFQELTVIPRKPRYHEQYYSIGPDGVLEPGTWMNDFLDRMLYKLGNYYHTPEEAEANRDKWVAFYASDEVLEV